MAFYLHASLYEVKTNLSAFIRALNRGATDYVVIRRYGRDVAFLRPIKITNDPPMKPETETDLAMWRRAVFVNDSYKSRRGG